jgi:hypothetical protein
MKEGEAGIASNERCGNTSRAPSRHAGDHIVGNDHTSPVAAALSLFYKYALFRREWPQNFERMFRCRSDFDASRDFAAAHQRVF